MSNSRLPRGGTEGSEEFIRRASVQLVGNKVAMPFRKGGMGDTRRFKGNRG